jgi:hypothetical protein
VFLRHCYLVVFCLLAFSFNAHSKTFKNAYIAFEMQDDWKCNLEQTEWVCRADDPQEAKEAVIILTAKEKGPTDNFTIYEQHLNSPIETFPRVGAKMISILKYNAQKSKINDHLWLDGLHQDSEVKNYFTRYMATTKDQIAILVTFSAHNKAYAKHSINFEKAIRTLRVVAAKDINKYMAGEKMPFGSERFGTDRYTTDVANISAEIARGPASENFNAKKTIALGVMVLAIALFLISRLMGKRNN